MLNELRCLLKYGRTRFSLMEKYGISLMRVRMAGETLKTWSACSDVMEFDYTHDGEWTEGDTPFEALSRCIEAVRAMES